MRVPVLPIVVLCAGLVGAGAAESSDRSGQVSVRFPAFALSPGERIAGVKPTSSDGRIFAGCQPNRWTCEEQGNTMHRSRRIEDPGQDEVGIA